MPAPEALQKMRVDSRLEGSCTAEVAWAGGVKHCTKAGVGQALQ